MAQPLVAAPVAAAPATARVWHPLLLTVLSFVLTAPAAAAPAAVAMFRLGRRGLGIAYLVAIPLLAAAFAAIAASSGANQLWRPYVFDLVIGLGMALLLRRSMRAAQQAGVMVGRAPWWQGVLLALGVVAVMIVLGIIGFNIYDSHRYE